MKRKFVITVQYASGRVEYHKADNERHKDSLVRNNPQPSEWGLL